MNINSIQVKVGDLEQTKQGSFVVPNNENAFILLNNLIKINFKFIDDTSKKGGISFVGEGTNLEIQCVNCENVLGEGIRPVKIGVLNGRELWIAFMINTYSLPENQKLRTVNYSFYEK